MLSVIIDDEYFCESLEDLERQVLAEARAAWERRVASAEEYAERKMAQDLSLLPRPPFDDGSTVKLWEEALKRSFGGTCFD